MFVEKFSNIKILCPSRREQSVCDKKRKLDDNVNVCGSKCMKEEQGSTMCRTCDNQCTGVEVRTVSKLESLEFQQFLMDHFDWDKVESTCEEIGTERPKTKQCNTKGDSRLGERETSVMSCKERMDTPLSCSTSTYCCAEHLKLYENRVDKFINVSETDILKAVLDPRVVSLISQLLLDKSLT